MRIILSFLSSFTMSLDCVLYQPFSLHPILPQPFVYRVNSQYCSLLLLFIVKECYNSAFSIPSVLHCLCILVSFINTQFSADNVNNKRL